MPALRPDILVIGLDPAGLALAFGAALARVPVVVVTQGPRPKGLGGLDLIHRLAALGASVLEGEARFRDSAHVYVGDYTITARRIVLALPARAGEAALPGLAAVPRWWPGAPATTVLVLGGGPKAPALALAARKEGHRTHLVTPGGLLPGLDVEGVGIMGHRLRREGIEHHAAFEGEGARVEACPEGFLLYPPAGAPIGFSHVCLPDSQAPDFSSLALGEAGVVIEGCYPRLARDGLSTSNARVLAIGASRSPLADPVQAAAEARIALANLLFRQSPAAALARLPRLAHGPLTLLEAGLAEAALSAMPKAGLRYYRTPLRGGGFLKAVTNAKGQVQRVVVLAQAPGALAGPLLQLMADSRPLAELASLPLAHLDEADALALLGSQAVAERLSGWGARLTMRLLRLLG